MNSNNSNSNNSANLPRLELLNISDLRGNQPDSADDRSTLVVNVSSEPYSLELDRLRLNLPQFMEGNITLLRNVVLVSKQTKLNVLVPDSKLRATLASLGRQIYKDTKHYISEKIRNNPENEGASHTEINDMINNETKSVRFQEQMNETVKVFVNNLRNFNAPYEADRKLEWSKKMMGFAYDDYSDLAKEMQIHCEKILQKPITQLTQKESKDLIKAIQELTFPYKSSCNPGVAVRFSS